MTPKECDRIARARKPVRVKGGRIGLHDYPGTFIITRIGWRYDANGGAEPFCEIYDRTTHYAVYASPAKLEPAEKETEE